MFSPQKPLVGLIATALVFSTFVIFPYAQSEIPDKGISVSPIKFELSGDPGSTVEGAVKYYNATGTPKKLYLRTANFEPSDDGVPIIVKEEREYLTSLKDWIKLENYTVEVDNVKPDESLPTIVNFKVEIPQDASPGGYYALILQSINPPGQEPGEISGAVTNPESAAIVLLNVNGDVSRETNIETFAAIDPYTKQAPFTLFGQTFFEYPPVQFVYKINNTGTTHITPKGNIFLKRGKKQIETYPINKGQGSVLPNSSRSYNEATWGEGTFVHRKIKTDDQGSPVLDKNNDPVTELSFDWNKLTYQPWGKFNAQLVVVYQDGEVMTQKEATVSYWVIPWKLILLIILIISIIVAYKVYKKKQEKKKA